MEFPFLFGRAFIEAGDAVVGASGALDFPSFLEGLSLRLDRTCHCEGLHHDFPSFLEGLSLRHRPGHGLAT